MKIPIIDKLNKDFFFFLFLFLIALIWLIISPSFFGTFEPDSLSYINGESARTSIYPYLIGFFFQQNLKYNYLIYFQIFFLTFSLILLLIVLRVRGHSFKGIFVIYLLLFLNIYYLSFSKTILTEAIFFSLINFATSLLILEKQLTKNYFLSILFGFIIGGIYAIKSVGIILFFFFFLGFLFFSLKYKRIKQIFVCLIFSSLLPILEHKIYFEKYESRSNVFTKSIIGKIFIISGSKKFRFENYNEIHKNFISIFRNDSKLINSYISNLKNPFLIANLKADYEVVGQYQYETQINEFQTKNNIENFNHFKKQLGFKMIFNHPIEFIKISLWHYFGLWAPGGKQLFVTNHENLPLTSKLNNSSSDIIFLKKIFLEIAICFFLLLFLFFTLFSIRCIFIILKRSWEKIDVFNILCLICQIYLILVSITNISTPRYLMPFYPVVVIIFCLYFKEMFIILKKNLNVRSNQK
tara:strand:+ start:1611 stop:3011 length:1401 start_codon:yes stop_codon:yes gene_type:complete